MSDKKMNAEVKIEAVKEQLESNLEREDRAMMQVKADKNQKNKVEESQKDTKPEQTDKKLPPSPEKNTKDVKKLETNLEKIISDEKSSRIDSTAKDVLSKEVKSKEAKTIVEERKSKDESKSKLGSVKESTNEKLDEVKNSEKAKDLESNLESKIDLKKDSSITDEIISKNKHNKETPKTDHTDKSEKPEEQITNELETKYKEIDESEKIFDKTKTNEKAELNVQAKMTDYGAPDYKDPKCVTNPNYESETTKQVLTENEEIDPEIMTDHGVKTDNKKLYTAVGATLLGPIGIGLCLGYSSGAIESIKDDPNIDPTTNQISWFGSILTVGAAIGSLLSGNTIDKMGRKFHILLGNLCFAIGWLLIIVDKTSIELAIVGRLVGGIGVGIVAIAVPTYIGEVSPPDVRGTLGAAFQLLVTVGLTFAYVVQRWLTWHESALFSMCFNTLCVIMVYILTPLSPRWLLIQCERTQARESLAKLRNLEPNSEKVNNEIEEIEDSLQQVSAIGVASPKEIMTTKSLRTPFLILMVVHIGQQTNGINCVLFYAASIFKDAGLSDANLASILLGVTQIIGTLTATALMDKFGRRFLLLGSSIMMIIFLTVFGTYQNYVRYDRDPDWMEYMGLVSILMFSLSFSLGEGPVPWLVIGEMFDARAKGFCSAVCATLNWGASFLFAYFVADMNKTLGQDWTYWLFAILTACVTVFEFFFLPETKGKTLEEIQAKFQ